MKFLKILIICLLFTPLVVGAETISWTLPTTYTDGSAISATDKARITVYLRGYKKGNPAAKTYFGETRNGLESWGVAGDNTYIMKKMNEWAATNAVPGWVALVPGDNVLITVSATISWPDETGAMKEFDGPESPAYAWTIYKTPPAPPPPPPTPSCAAPAGLTIKP